MDDQSSKKLCQDIITKFAEAKSLEKIKSARVLFNFYSKIKRRSYNTKFKQWGNKARSLLIRDNSKNKLNHNQNTSYNANFTNNPTNSNSNTNLGTGMVNTTYYSNNTTNMNNTNMGYNMGNIGSYGGNLEMSSQGANVKDNNVNINVNSGVGKIRKTTQANQSNNKRKIHNTSDSTSFQNDEAQYNTVNQQMTTGELLEERNLANCTFK